MLERSVDLRTILFPRCWHPPSFNYRIYHQFLKQLIADAKGQKIHVIADNLRVHHSKVIKRWARRYAHLIELHYLPSYCSDLNPDEYLNCDF